MDITFQLVDVFGSGPFTGNPVAVFDGTGLDTDQMQRITRWMNLSESTFLLPPTTGAADYRVRIFTLERELPFAGHPTLGTCHAFVERNRISGKSEVIQECPAGLVPVRLRDSLWEFEAPPMLRSGPADEPLVQEVSTFLNIDRSRIVAAEWVDNGPGWLGILLSSAEEVLALEPVNSYPRRMDIGVLGPHRPDSGLAFEIRTFFSNHVGAIIEDPVTGSFQASAAQWMVQSGRARTPYMTAQGTCLGRSGRVRIAGDGNGIWVGGRTETLARGEAPFERPQASRSVTG